MDAGISQGELAQETFQSWSDNRSAAFRRIRQDSAGSHISTFRKVACTHAFDGYKEILKDNETEI